MGRIAPVIELSDKDRETLSTWTRSGKIGQRLALRARIVLSAARSARNLDIARELGTREATVSKWRSRFHQAGLKGLQDKPRSGKPSKYTPSTEKSILAALDKPPPKGYALTLRNPLLNFHLMKAKGLKIEDEIPQEVYRILVRGQGDQAADVSAGRLAARAEVPQLDSSHSVFKVLKNDSETALSQQSAFLLMVTTAPSTGTPSPCRR